MKLIVELGGLCMLVTRTASARPGLYVLMPRAHGPGAMHCPFFVCAAMYSASGNRPQVRHLKMEHENDEVDLTSVTNGIHGTAVLPRFVANVSKFYSPQISVDKNALDEPIHPGLAARIRLPIPATDIIGSGTEADFMLPTGATGNFVIANPRLRGRCLIEYEIHSSSTWNRQIKGAKLKAVDDVIRISFLNIRVKDLEAEIYQHDAGDTWDHQQAYHGLLEGKTSATGPRPLFAISVGGPEDKPDSRDCDDIDIDEWPSRSGGRFIDPYTCTLGGGCPPGESC